MQSAFLSGIYKRYGDLEGGHIVIYFARNLHLKVMRKREEDLDFDLSLDKFWFNHQNTVQDKLRIIAISRFWTERVNYSENKKAYVILGVTGPNEYENNVNNLSLIHI